ncbi:hypothetical protein GGQ99_004804 [Aminobacter niigataensis]|uniref:Uncharacterized protein n=1 Tax=Aminobacter niigataensis TaxID=83265 RepID=A0ABR6L8F4_9HYPH|nr:hypothetical protein [Aminobacter niigataensis]MBB4653020.1 hypothetical protein [Aminobacter niigataensis]
MVAAWPATLPQYLLTEGYSEAQGDGRLRTQPDLGPAKVRRRSSSMPGPLQGRMTMSGAQRTILDDFVETTLAGGTLPFTFPDPLTRAPILVRFSANLPAWSSPGGDTFIAALDLEVLP